MGMFDTFRGEIKCPYCGKMHEFEEQTKSYECMLEDFYLGDYINSSNEDTEPITAYCHENNKEFYGMVIIFHSQIVAILNDIELEKIDLDNLNEIEEGLGRRLIYEECCKQGVGFNNDIGCFGSAKHRYEESKWEQHPKHIGDSLYVLGNDWTITDSYREILKNDGESSFIGKLHFRPNYVYKITGKLGDRIVKVEKNYSEVTYSKGMKEYNHRNGKNDYYIDFGCYLEKLSDYMYMI